MNTVSSTKTNAANPVSECHASNDLQGADASVPSDRTSGETWSLQSVMDLFQLPLMILLDRAHGVHKAHHDPNSVQISTLLSIKTGSCPENCSYCPQSAHHNTGLKKEPLMGLDVVVSAAKKAKEAGASRFCMGAAWRGPNDQDLDKVIDMVCEVKKLGMETCVTLGLLEPHQAKRLADAGLDYYNHNIDTSEAFYGQWTRSLRRENLTTASKP